MHITWDPLIVAGVAAIVAGLLYLLNWMPRMHSFIGAAALVFFAAGTGLLALAHRPVPHGMWELVVVLGWAASVGLFIVIVLMGNHEDQLIKRKPKRSLSGEGGAAKTPKKAHPKAPHHRSLVVTTLAVAFSALLAFNAPSMWHDGRSGITQTFSGITQ